MSCKLSSAFERYSNLSQLFLVDATNLLKLSGNASSVVHF